MTDVGHVDITVEWTSFGGDASTEFSVYANITDEQLLEQLFVETNTYRGQLWDGMQPLPEDRTHTALSVGDHVTLNGQRFRCKSFGWEKV